MSSFDPNVILKTKPGQLRIAAVVVGLLAVAFCGAGHDHEKLLDWGQPKCSDQRSFFRCPQVWMAKMGLALIIIAWLFSIVMLIVSALPSLSQNPQIRMADSFGHIGGGVLAILGGLLCIVWIVTLFLARHCDASEFEVNGLKFNLGPTHTKFCADATWSTVDRLEVKKDKDGPGRDPNDRSAKNKNVKSRKGPTLTQADAEFAVNYWTETQAFVYYYANGDPYSIQFSNQRYVGAMGWLWIAGAVFAFIFGVLCIVIFLQLKKAGPRGPMMMGGMMTQQPSQAPMSMHPSQMTQQQQQQQNPDQQSVHPSQMTQQQG